MSPGCLLDTDWIVHYDLLIAASCFPGGLTLLTNNHRQFEQVEALALISS